MSTQIDDTAIYFHAVPRGQQDPWGSPGGQFIGGTLTQARAFAALALSWPGVDVVHIEPWTIKGNRPIISETHAADGTVSHFVSPSDGGDGERASGELPSVVLDGLGDAVRL
ncbi:hypothetical protein [Streptomyces sp. NPDC002537]